MATRAWIRAWIRYPCLSDIATGHAAEFPDLLHAAACGLRSGKSAHLLRKCVQDSPPEYDAAGSAFDLPERGYLTPARWLGLVTVPPLMTEYSSQDSSIRIVPDAVRLHSTPYAVAPQRKCKRVPDRVPAPMMRCVGLIMAIRVLCWPGSPDNGNGRPPTRATAACRHAFVHAPSPLFGERAACEAARRTFPPSNVRIPKGSFEGLPRSRLLSGPAIRLISSGPSYRTACTARTALDRPAAGTPERL